jgi:hypothetical protein
MTHHLRSERDAKKEALEKKAGECKHVTSVKHGNKYRCVDCGKVIK